MDFIEIVKAVVLGIVEGLTEFLPVSSTAHLIVLARVLGFEDGSGAFKVAIQLGAIAALLVVYFRKIFDTVVSLPSKPEARRFALSVALAFVPAVILGLLLGDLIDSVFLEGQMTDAAAKIIASTLIIGGVVMLLVERFRPVPTDTAADALPLWKSVAIGFFQALALVPGVSRSGATIVGSLMLGVERRAAAEFSFFLSIPTMTAAVGYKIFQDRDQLDFSEAQTIAVGFVCAFLAAILVVKSFLAIVSKYGLWPFAWYRIALGLFLLASTLLAF
jgi:undecaprenyl-diphosphatase